MANGATVKESIRLRRCRVCRRQLPQAELHRWTLVNGQFVRDAVGDRTPGRGYYSCSDRCDEILPKTMLKKKKG